MSCAPAAFLLSTKTSFHCCVESHSFGSFALAVVVVVVALDGSSGTFSGAGSLSSSTRNPKFLMAAISSAMLVEWNRSGGIDEDLSLAGVGLIPARSEVAIVEESPPLVNDQIELPNEREAGQETEDC